MFWITLLRMLRAVAFFSLHIGADAYGAAMHERDANERLSLFRKAERWYRQSASLGNAQAATNLGYVYSYGRVGETDYRQAFQWFSRGAEFGNEEACYKLGDLYKSGKGCEKDTEKALELYRQAAAIAFEVCDPDVPDGAAVLGSIELRLGEWYEHNGMPSESLTIAYEFYTQAASLFQVAVEGGLTWYRKTMDSAQSGALRCKTV